MTSLSELIKNNQTVKPPEAKANTIEPVIELDDALNKFSLFVSDSPLTPGIREKLALHAPILEFRKKDSQKFLNRDIPYLISKGFKSLWVCNTSVEANVWVSGALTNHRNKCVVIGVYTKRKKQRFLQELKADLIIRKSSLDELMVLTAEELIESMKGSSLGNTIHRAAGPFSRMFSCGKLIDGSKN